MKWVLWRLNNRLGKMHLVGRGVEDSDQAAVGAALKALEQCGAKYVAVKMVGPQWEVWSR